MPIARTHTKGVVVVIQVPKEIYKEVKQQIYADKNYGGFNMELIIILWAICLSGEESVLFE